MHHVKTRINYDSYVPSGSDPPITTLELVEERAMARAYHLCALGYLLANFNPEHPIDTGWENSIALRSYGLLIESISQGIFGDIDALLELSTPANADNINPGLEGEEK